jgi:hypothetical protein
MPFTGPRLSFNPLAINATAIPALSLHRQCSTTALNNGAERRR